MYDEVKFEIDCPTCGMKVNNFQTKDGDLDFKTVEYWEVDNFYSACSWCNTWIEYVRKEKKPFVPIKHYKMNIKVNEIPESRITRNKEGKISGFKGKD